MTYDEFVEEVRLVRMCELNARTAVAGGTGDFIPTPPPFAKEVMTTDQRELFKKSGIELRPCGCLVSVGWDCPLHEPKKPRIL